jgi:hypothetical protein
VTVVLERRAVLPDCATKLLQNVSQRVTAHQPARKIFVLLGEDRGKISNSLFLAHVFGVGVVVDGVLTHPHFYFPVLVLADHVLCDFDRTVDRHQPFEALNDQFDLLLGPLLQR